MNFASPQPFIIREECHKAAWQHGFRRVLGEENGWVSFGSTTAQGTIWLAAESIQGPWFLALDHPGVVAELALPPASIAGPGTDRYSFPTLTALYAILPRLYALSISLPDEPLKTFHKQTANLPKATEAERLVVQRIGQGIFRASLMDYTGKDDVRPPASPTPLCSELPISSPGVNAPTTASASTCTTACCCPPSGTPPLTAP